MTLTNGAAIKPCCERHRNQIACSVCGRPNPKYAQRTHGLSKSPTYGSWLAMKKRCGSEKHPAYHRYGGRGIAVDPRWMVFETFLADMGARPEGKTLDRYPDKDGNYEPGNCRWATSRQQSLNRCDTHYITIGDETRPLKEWCREHSIAYATVWQRIRRGWSPGRALIAPLVVPASKYSPNGVCAQCGRHYIKRRLRAQDYCSRSCATRARHMAAA